MHCSTIDFSSFSCEFESGIDDLMKKNLGSMLSHMAKFKGRYSSLAKGISDEHNSQEEDMFGWMNWELLRTGKGVYKNIDSQRYEWWDEVDISEAGFKKAIQDRPIFTNVNDRFSENSTKYEHEIEWFHNAMEIMFPLENRNGSQIK